MKYPLLMGYSFYLAKSSTIKIKVIKGKIKGNSIYNLYYWNNAYEANSCRKLRVIIYYHLKIIDIYFRNNIYGGY